METFLKVTLKLSTFEDKERALGDLRLSKEKRKELETPQKLDAGTEVPWIHAVNEEANKHLAELIRIIQNDKQSKSK